MPIANTDIQYRLSGGASNSDAAAALGGAKSNTAVPSGQFDNVTSAEAAAGDVEYRCFYVHNNHGSLTLTSAKVWIQANTPSTDTTVDIGLGSSAINGTEQTIADEQTAPTSVTFSAAANEGASLSIGDLGPGQHKAVWIRRTVNSSAAVAADSYTLRVKGNTLP